MKYIREHAVDIVIIAASIAVAVYIGIEHNLELALSFSSIPIAFLIAKWYGDVAGGKSARKYEKEKAAKARIAALRSLLNEIKMIRALVSQNSNLGYGDSHLQSVLKMPTTAFETAFLSGESSLLDERDDESSEILVSVTDYLTQAYSINTLADNYLALVARVYGGSAEGWKQGIIRHIKQKCEELPKILDRLESNLKRRLKDEAAA